MSRPYTRRDPLDRFTDKFEVIDSGCWLWTGGLNSAGYPKFFINGGYQYAHRWIYEQLVGPIPDRHEIDHLCFEPRCVHPDHHEAVTKAENLARMRLANRDTCAHGHPYTPENTYRRRDDGTRQCRICNHTKYLRRRAQQPSASAEPALTLT